MKFLTKKSASNQFIASIDANSCRIHLFNKTGSKLVQLKTHQFEYASLDELKTKTVQWLRQNPCKDYDSRWVLNRELYQTYQVDPPKVTEKEMNEAIKWQIKDLLEHPVADVLVSHYRLGHGEQKNAQLTAVVVKKELIETLIELTHQLGLRMNAIEIEELSTGCALISHLNDDRITGYIGQDKNGLIYNFYCGETLFFTRHKKGRHLPYKSAQDFSLEAEQQELEEAFLLETQRTMDYVVSQVFRRPVENLLIENTSEEDEAIADMIKQLTEIEVTLINPAVNPVSDKLLKPALFEVGAALRESG